VDDTPTTQSMDKLVSGGIEELLGMRPDLKERHPSRNAPRREREMDTAPQRGKSGA